MPDLSDNEWETVTSDELSDQTVADRSGFSTWGSESAVSLLEAYQDFFADMSMMLNLPSSANAAENSLFSLDQRVLSDFEPIYSNPDNFAQFVRDHESE